MLLGVSFVFALQVFKAGGGGEGGAGRGGRKTRPNLFCEFS